MNRIQRYIITATFTAISLFLMWYFSSVVFYILISAVLSFIGKPLVDLLSRIKIKERITPKWLSATIALVVMWSLAILMFWMLVPIILDKLNVISQLNISDFVTSLSAKMHNIELFINKNLSLHLNQSETFVSTISDKLTEYITPTLVGIGSLVDGAVSLVIGAFSVSFITFFFLKESDLFRDGVQTLFPSKYEENANRAIVSSTNLLSRYFIGLLIESTIKLIIIAVALTFANGLSVGDAVIIALISAVLNVIPYIGPIIGAVVGIIIAIASPEMTASTDISFEIIKMVIIFGAFQLIDNIIIQPYVYSSSVKAHPLEIFIVILLAGSMAGITGMLLAIPAYTVIRVFAKEFFNKFKVVQKLTQKI